MLARRPVKEMRLRGMPAVCLGVHVHVHACFIKRVLWFEFDGGDNGFLDDRRNSSAHWQNEWRGLHVLFSAFAAKVTRATYRNCKDYLNSL